ncbi:MAG: cellulose biosynthesis cyclic di-GMP-binding regulatory protein BcsB [Robiginitomaculum sp.]
MSHNSHKIVSQNRSFTYFYKSLALFAVTFIGLIALPSMAAVAPQTKISKTQSYILKTTLDKFDNTRQAQLDWRTPSYEISFDLPAHNRYENLDLFISAYPDGNVNRSTPLMISYNGAKPIALHGKGSRFDAHIRLDPSRIRTRSNTIKISYNPADGEQCLTDNSGKWTIDLSHSKLVSKIKENYHNLQIIDLKQRLNNPMTAPKRIAITAFGPNKKALEALIAQGVAQQISTVPDFGFSSAHADYSVVIGTYDDVRNIATDKSLVSGHGAKVLADNAARPRLLLVANTYVQVLELARAFATYELPNARRNKAFINEFYSGTHFKSQTLMNKNKYSLTDLGNIVLTPSWHPKPVNINFNVTDSKNASGVVILGILSAKDINPNSRVKVLLNEQSLGYTQLNKTKKTIAFNIKPGQLKASGNQIRIEVSLIEPKGANICVAQKNVPTLLISNRSHLLLKNNHPSPASDLNRFVASGAPFNQSAAIVLTAKTNKDRAATLKFLAFSAKQFGPTWTGADYFSSLSDVKNSGKNILIIGPNAMADSQLIAAAPTALKLVLDGKAIDGPNRIAINERHASPDATASFQMAAARVKSSRITSGGIAAIFKSPYAKGRLIGIISSDKPSNFARAAITLSTPEHWNALEGGVVRWNSQTILMAQTAVDLPISFTPSPSHASGENKWANVKSAPERWASALRSKWAKNKQLPMTKKTTNEQIAKTKAPTIPVPNIKIAYKEKINQPWQKLRLKLPKLETTKQAILKLRGPSKISRHYQLASQKRTIEFPNFARIKMNTTTKWSALKIWANSKFAKYKYGHISKAKVKTWVRSLGKSKALMFMLLAFSALFLLGFAAPKYR